MSQCSNTTVVWCIVQQVIFSRYIVNFIVLHFITCRAVTSVFVTLVLFMTGLSNPAPGGQLY